MLVGACGCCLGLVLGLGLGLGFCGGVAHHSQEAEVRDATVLTLFHCARVKGVAVHIQVVSAFERVNLPCTRGAGASAASGAARRGAARHGLKAQAAAVRT